jgi:hypothetical protein
MLCFLLLSELRVHLASASAASALAAQAWPVAYCCCCWYLILLGLWQQLWQHQLRLNLLGEQQSRQEVTLAGLLQGLLPLETQGL